MSIAQSIASPGVLRVASSVVASSGGPVVPGTFNYLRPASTDKYLRPDGTSLFKRPA